MAASPLALYASGLEGDAPAPILRARTGELLPAPFARWLGPVEAADEDVLARTRGPVLDVGCGVGRHVGALCERGCEVLGVDLARAAVRVGRRRGLPVVHGDVFGPVRDAGRWQTVLLLDENLGIGGCPVALLGRVTELLAPDGQVLVELTPPGAGSASLDLRLELGRRCSAWFLWGRVEPRALPRVAREAGLHVVKQWSRDGRWFAALERAA